MKPILVLILFISFISNSLSQHRGKTSNLIYGIEIQYSYFQQTSKTLNTFLTTNYDHPITDYRLVGINFKYIMNWNRKKYHDFNMNFDYVLPTNYTSNSSTRSFSINGYQWGMMILGNDLLHKKKKIDLIIGTGFNAGKFNLHQDNETTTLDFSNKFFAPKITSEFRLIFGKMCAGIRAEYQYDLSNKNWNSNSNESLPSTKFTGAKLQVFVGFGKVSR